MESPTETAPSGLSTGHYLLLALVVAAAAFLFLWGLGSYPLWDPWEPKYAQSIKAMQERGDLITPYLNDKIRWTKPILFYWAMFVPLQLFGESEFAVRLPSAIAALLALLLVYFFVRRLHDRRSGLLAAAILGTLPQYYFMARQTMPDMLLTLFLCGALGCFALARFGESHRKRYFMAFYACVALAFLTKGPVACAITLGAVLIFWLIDFDPRTLCAPARIWCDFKKMLRDYHVGPGVIIFLAISAPWYATIWIIHGQQFIDSFIIGENIHRFMQPSFALEGLASYYLDTILHGMFPWASLLPLALLCLLYGHSSIDESFRLKWYYISWFTAILLIFSIASTKLDHYILPITPVVAILVALAWKSYLDADAPSWVRPALLLAIPVALLPIRDYATKGAGLILNCFIPHHEVTAGAAEMLFAAQLCFAVWALVMLLACLLRHSKAVVVLALLTSFMYGAYLTQKVLPLHSRERTLKTYTDLYSELEEPGTELVYYGWLRYSLHYYHGKERFHYFEPEQLTELIQFVRDKPRVYLIAQDEFFENLLLQLERGTQRRWSSISTEHPVFHLISNTAPGAGGE